MLRFKNIFLVILGCFFLTTNALSKDQAVKEIDLTAHYDHLAMDTVAHTLGFLEADELAQLRLRNCPEINHLIPGLYASDGGSPELALASSA